MSILIGHASISEHNSISGSTGDQNGKEVCTRSWYAKPWNVMLTCTDRALANAAAANMKKAIDNPRIGYSQPNRMGAYHSAMANGNDFTKAGGDTDCSQLAAACYIFAGLPISPSCTTRNLRTAMLATGKFVEYTDSAHLNSDAYAEIGALYLKEGSHVVMALENGSGSVSQTRPPATDPYPLKTFIKDIQKIIDSDVDGIAGPITLSKTVTVSRSINSRHAIVKPLQNRLNALSYVCGTADGIAGVKFDRAVKTFQKANGCIADGEFTKAAKSWRCLLSIR